MTSRPAPLVPADCDLRDFAFMPLDVARLRDSDLAANETPEACWAAVLLWAASWHQVPAGSIPNDDRWIAKTAGYAQRGKIAREWKAVREGALRNWIECDDGRLYHPVVAEKANAAWDGRVRQRWMTECARIKKHNQRHAMSLEIPTFEEWVSLGCPSGQTLPVPGDKVGRPQEIPRDRASKGEGEGEREGESIPEPNGSGPKPPAKPADLLADDPAEAERQLYQRGRKVLGKEAGGLISKLLKAKAGNVALARAAIEQASQKSDPREFIGAVIRGPVGAVPPGESRWAL